MMETPTILERSQPLPEPNPVTRQAHRRQAFWQITVPFMVILLVILLMTGGAIWTAVGGAEEVSRWAAISTIWLLIPPMILSFLGLIVLCGLVFVMGKLLYYLPRYARIIQDRFVNLPQLVKYYSDKVVQPILRFRGLKASVDKFRQKIGRLNKG